MMNAPKIEPKCVGRNVLEALYALSLLLSLLVHVLHNRRVTSSPQQTRELGASRRDVHIPAALHAHACACVGARVRDQLSTERVCSWLM